jgi:hypothetical protein
VSQEPPTMTDGSAPAPAAWIAASSSTYPDPAKVNGWPVGGEEVVS